MVYRGPGCGKRSGFGGPWPTCLDPIPDTKSGVGMSPAKRRATVAGIAGAVVTAATVGVVFGTGSVGAAAGASLTPSARPAAPRVAQSLTLNLAMDHVVAEATRGDTTFVLAPGAGQFATPGELCFAVINASEMSGPGFRQGSTSSFGCGPAAQSETNRNMATQRDLAGNITVWGFVPEGTTSVTAAGQNIPLTGRLFDSPLPTSARTVLLSTPPGTKVLNVAPPPPK